MPCNLCPESTVHGIAYCPEAHVVLRYCREHYEQQSVIAQVCFLCGAPLTWAHGEAADSVIRGFGPERSMRARAVNQAPGGSSVASGVASSMAQLGEQIGAPSLVVTPRSSGKLSSISGPSPVLEPAPPKGVGLKMWVRCPYGCFFEISAKSPLKLDSKDHTVTCSACHRISSAKQFKTVKHAHVLEVIGNVWKINIAQKLDIKSAVIARLNQLVGSWFWWINREQRLEELYGQLRDLLLRSEITSNFPTPRIYGLLSSGFMKNMWHFTKAGSTKYAQERDLGERQVFGKLFKGISDISFPVSVWRPVYVALNLGNRLPGPCPNYGRSYLIYKDAVKARATFLATDSLQMIKGEAQKKEGARQSVDESTLATIANIEKVLLRVSDRQLKYMCAMLVEGQTVTNPNEFIEVHVWGEISLLKDVKAMVVSEVDIDDFVRLQSSEPDVLPQFYKELSAEQRRQETRRLKGMIKEFCELHGIEFHLIPLGSDTMNSMERRPPAPVRRDDDEVVSIAPAKVEYKYDIPDWAFNPKNPQAVPNRVLQDARSGLYLPRHRIKINDHEFIVHLFDTEPTNDNWKGTGVYLMPRLRGG